MSLWTRLFGCRHGDCYRERRRLDGRGPLVLHLVCARCGRAIPAMPRTAAEHRAIVAAGRSIAPTVTRASAVVADIRDGRRR